MLLSYLSSVESSRRAQAQQYDTASVLLLTILATSSGCTSYRKIHEYITIKFTSLKRLLNLDWKKPPVYNSLRYILISIDTKSLEGCFRKYSKYLQQQESISSNTSHPDYLQGYQILAVDGKCLKGSFDNMEDQKMKQILSVFKPKLNLL